MKPSMQVFMQSSLRKHPIHIKKYSNYVGSSKQTESPLDNEVQ